MKEKGRTSNKPVKVDSKKRKKKYDFTQKYKME